MSNKPILLRESVTEAPVKSGGKWRAVVARPGQGSSGKYSAEVLKRDAAKIIPADAQCFINHDITRNPRDMVGIWSEGYWDESEQAVVSELKVFSHFDEFVSEVGPYCGVSIFALGEKDEDDNVTAFFEDRYNGADLVARPGLEGSGLAEKLSEAHKHSEETPGVEVAPELQKKETKMDEKAIAAIEALTAQVTALVTAQTAKAEENAKIEATDEALAEAAETAVESYAVKVEAIEAAREDLLPSQVKHLMTEAKAGREVAGLIESYKEMVAEAKTTLTESSAGRVMGGSTETKYGAWA